MLECWSIPYFLLPIVRGPHAVGGRKLGIAGQTTLMCGGFNLILATVGKVQHDLF